jgi:hypothetical protein
MRVVRVFEDERESVIDSWDVLNGLTKCERYGTVDREEYAQTLAITWAVYTSREREIVGVEA